MFPGWYNPRTDLKSIKGETRLLVRLEKDGSATVNPTSEGLGGIEVISLRGLTLKAAQTVWGAGRGTNGNMTFDLITEASCPEKDIYHLDGKFKDNKLIAYRLRGIGISKPKWTSIGL